MKFRSALLFACLFVSVGAAADSPDPTQGLDAYMQKVMA
jgi:outer membrane lipoprotein-sorting protein